MKNKKTIALAMAAATVAPMAVPAFAAERIIAPEEGKRTVDINVIDGRAVRYVKVVNLKEVMTTLENKGLKPAIVGQDKNVDGETIGYAVEYNTNDYTVQQVANAKAKRDEINKYLKLIKDEKIENTNKLRYTITEKTTEYTFADKAIKAPSKTIITVQDNIKTKLEDGTNGYAKYEFVFRNVDTKFVVSEDIVITRDDVTFNTENETDVTMANTVNEDAYKELSKYVYFLQQRVAKDSLHVTTKLKDGNMIIKVYKKDKATQIEEYTINGYKANFLATVLPVIPVKNDFTGHWAEKAIVDAMLDGVIKVSATVNPKADMTRAQFAELVCNSFEELNAEQVKPNFTSPFKDVSNGDWYARYVMKLNEKGLINGYEDGTFRPDATITRQEAAVVFAAIENGKTDADGKYKLVDKTTKDTDGKAVHKDIKTKFADDAKIPAWCDEAVAFLSTDEKDTTKNGRVIISGYTDNTFRPATKIKIAEGIMMSHQARKPIQ